MNASPKRRKTKPYNPAKMIEDRLAKFLVPVEVDDPYEAGAKIIAMRSIRQDPIADMLARGHVTECEFETARHWQRAYENAEIGGVGAMDTTKEPVDGGRMREVLTDRQLAANKELAAARGVLGAAGNYLIIQVLGTRKTLEMVASEAHWGNPGEAQYKYIRRRFHECLNTMAELFGYASKPIPGRGS